MGARSPETAKGYGSGSARYLSSSSPLNPVSTGGAYTTLRPVIPVAPVRFVIPTSHSTPVVLVIPAAVALVLLASVFQLPLYNLSFQCLLSLLVNLSFQ